MINKTYHIYDIIKGNIQSEVDWSIFTETWSYTIRVLGNHVFENSILMVSSNTWFQTFDK